MNRPVASLERRLREVGAHAYHDRHPFHRLLHDGALDRRQVQAWALNRFYYQASIPKKDAALIARTDDPRVRREWSQRLRDHDGDGEDPGGIERWLDLCVALGLPPDDVRAHVGVLPATRFAVDAYVRFVSERTLLEAVASSLTELFAPRVIEERMRGMLEHYDFVDRTALTYFDRRLDQAPRDVEFALRWVLDHARTTDDEDAAVDALRFKCSVLWAQLDALYHAYVEPGHAPPGAFDPTERERAS